MAAGGGGQEPNLTPFIDLFSVLICFLLMTAAWLQLEGMPADIEKAAAREPSSEPQPEPPKKTRLSVTLERGVTVFAEDERQTRVPAAGRELNADRIRAVLAQWKMKYPDRGDLILSSRPGVVYGDLIRAYDLLVQAGWPDVGIDPK
jgi:biopolymer transport protein ExbD